MKKGFVKGKGWKLHPNKKAGDLGFPEGVDFTGSQMESFDALYYFIEAAKTFQESIQLVLNIKFGKWELPAINIGGKADYTAYSLN